MAALAVIWPLAGAAAEAKTYFTGYEFLAQSAARRAAYVAGLADSLIGLHTARLTGGFQWFQTCAADKSAPELAMIFADFLNKNPARKPESAANNFIWAMGAVCEYTPLK